MTVDFSDYFWVRKWGYFTELGVTNTIVKFLRVSLKETYIECVVEIFYTFNFTSLMYYRQFLVWLASMIILENWLVRMFAKIYPNVIVVLTQND
jgi:hypothetical protein